MTLQPIAQELKMDRVEISWRFDENDFDMLYMVQSVLRTYVQIKRAAYMKPRWYRNSRIPSQVVQIPLSQRQWQYLTIESGAAKDDHGSFHPYAKFIFNVTRLAANQEARENFHGALLDIIPHEGFPLLLEEGFVNYAEFAADFRGVNVHTIDAYCPTLEQSHYFVRDGAVKTINLHDGKPGRPKAFCIYDKWQADWERNKHLRRGPLVRIEAKRRFNRTPTYRKLRFLELARIPNPFAPLRIYERNLIEQQFTAARHRNFLAHIQREGVQAAIAGTRGADRERRKRMLEACRAEWWNPEQVWAGKTNAILTGIML